MATLGRHDFSPRMTRSRFHMHDDGPQERTRRAQRLAEEREKEVAQIDAAIAAYAETAHFPPIAHAIEVLQARRAELTREG